MKIFNVVVMYNSTLWSGQYGKGRVRVRGGGVDGVQGSDDILMEIEEMHWSSLGSGWSAWYKGWVMRSGSRERAASLSNVVRMVD